MTTERTMLWERLRAADLVAGDAPSGDAAGSSWPVRATVGAAAWLAAIFFFGFIVLAMPELLRTPTSSFVTALVLCGIAVAAFATMSAFDFVTQFAFATSIAGQAAFAAGALDLHASHWGAAMLLLCAFQALLAVLVRHCVHRAWCAFAAATALMIALHEWHAATIFPGLLAAGIALIGLNEARLARVSALLHPVLVGLGLVLLLLIPAAIAASSALFGPSKPEPAALRWIGIATAGAVLVVTVLALLVARGIAPGSRFGLVALVAAVLVAALAAPLPALIASLVLVLVAFDGGNRALTGVGLLALGGSLAYYYYSLDAPLLAKSGALLATGVVMLLARAALGRSPASPAREIHHA